MVSAICTRCGHVGPSKFHSKGNIWAAIVLAFPSALVIARAFYLSWMNVIPRVNQDGVFAAANSPDANMRVGFVLMFAVLCGIPFGAYCIYVLATLKKGCALCGENALIPANSPQGSTLLRTGAQERDRAQDLRVARAEIRELIGR